TTESALLGFLLVTLLAPGWPIMAKMMVAALFALAGTFLFLRVIRSVPPRDVLLVPLIGIMLSGIIGAVTSFFAYRFGLGWFAPSPRIGPPTVSPSPGWARISPPIWGSITTRP
ncbi:MAG: transporter permease, partial [Devosia sp.]|nr:transporter permease [Devosia sp.]